MPKSKTPKITFLSPVGIAKYPHITERDVGHQYSSNKFDTRIVVTDPESPAAIAFMKTVNDAANAAGITGPKLPYKINDEGQLEIKAKSEYIPAIIDAKNTKVERLPKGFKVRGGSTIRMAGTLNVYDKGVSLWLNQVQVIELVEAAESMFEPIEGSWTADELDSDESEGSFTDASGPDI